MKKTAVILTLIALVISLFTGCNAGDKNNNNNTDGGADVQIPETVTLKIAGAELSEYKIVYARSEYYKQGPKTFTTEWDFYKLIAKDVSDRISALTGVSLAISQDTKTEESAREILVGPTNRAQSDVYDKMDVYSYQNTVNEGKLILGGGYDASYLTDKLKTSYSWGATYHAFDFIEEHIKAQMNEGNSEIDLAEGFEQKGSVELKTVACIGDSITEGHGSTDWNYCSYPAVMQRVLWKDHVIINYGKSAKTMRTDLSGSYMSTDAYRAAQKHKSSFDALVIMLGINDGGVDNVEFTAAEDKLFNDSAMKLVNTLTPSGKDLKVAILNCTAYYGTNPGTREHVRDLQKALVPMLTEKGYETTFVDMETYTSKEMGRSHFPDGIHPDTPGYAMLGEYIAQVVLKMFEETSEG